MAQVTDKEVDPMTKIDAINDKIQAVEAELVELRREREEALRWRERTAGA